MSAPRRRYAALFESNQTKIEGRKFLLLLLAFNFISFLREALQIHGDQAYLLSLPYLPEDDEAGTV